MKKILPQYKLHSFCRRCGYRTGYSRSKCPVCGIRLNRWDYIKDPNFWNNYNPVKPRTLRKLFGHKTHFATKDKRYRR